MVGSPAKRKAQINVGSWRSWRPLWSENCEYVHRPGLEGGHIYFPGKVSLGKKEAIGGSDRVPFS